MSLTLVGIGCGTAATLTEEGREALLAADCLIGAARLLESLPEGCTPCRKVAVRTGEILALLDETGAERPCVLFSGDTGFHSGAAGLLAALKAAGKEARVIPGISSVQLLAARLGRPWQDWKLCSAHGAACDPVSAVMEGRPAFFLTGGTDGPGKLCHYLTEAGLGALPVTVGERLSYDDERIVTATAAELAERSFAALSVVLAEAAPIPQPRRTPGFDDSAFLRGEVPMTKQEVRSAVLGKLALRPTDTVWDVGAGTGSVSVEMALAAHQGRVFAVECREEACDLVRQTRERFGAWNLTVVPGTAPEALADLPAPDAVFVGGSKGHLEEIVSLVLGKNPHARICVSAIALETLASATAALTAAGLEAEVCQIAVSRTRLAGKLHLLMAANPVFLICARQTGGES